MASIPRLRDYRGPAIFSYGFRPFFLLGSLYAGMAILAWLPMFNGDIALPTAFAPRDWHIHEMLYGYLTAVMTGFLLTAIPNWTVRLPLQGRPLFMLVSAWVAGRLAVATSLWTGLLLAAAIDVSFLLLVMTFAAREIAAGASRQTLKILAVLAVFAVGNICFHLEAYQSPRHMLRSAGGAALMGAGGVMAFGCSVGQGLTGLSTLSLASFIAVAGILIGTAAGLRGMLKVQPLAAS